LFSFVKSSSNTIFLLLIPSEIDDFEGSGGIAKVCKNTKNMLARNLGLGAIAYLYDHKLKHGKN
jgi:hypothetical protein